METPYARVGMNHVGTAGLSYCLLEFLEFLNQ